MVKPVMRLASKHRERGQFGAVVTVREFDPAWTELSREVTHNVVTLYGKRAILDRLVVEDAPIITGIALGDNNTPEGSGDAALFSELIRIPLTSFTDAVDNGTSGLLTVVGVLGSTEGNGNTYREAALTFSLTAGASDIVNRVTFSDKAKSVSKILVLQFDFILT